MNNNDGIFRPAGAQESAPSPSAGSAGTSYYDASSELPTPGHLREDASAWDRMSDGQRKLIALAALVGIVLILVLIVGIFSGGACSGCSICSGCGTVSGSDAVSDSQVDVPDEPIFSDDTSVIIDNTDSDEEIVPDEEPADSDLPDADTEKSGFFSSCNHEADNEAGGGSNSGSTGFLGFLFGCTSCVDSCSISCNTSLTDPIGSGITDPDRDNTLIVSGTDEQEDIWPQEPDDEAYLAMLSDRLTDISDLFIRLGELDTALSQYTDAQRVRDNDSFRAVAEEILLWCEGAETYNTGLLESEQANACSDLSIRLASSLRTYVESYPQLITGDTSGSDLIDRADQINTVMNDIVVLFTTLHSAPTADEAVTE